MNDGFLDTCRTQLLLVQVCGQLHKLLIAILMYHVYPGTGRQIWTISMTTRRGAATEHWTDEGWTKVGMICCPSLEQPIGKANCICVTMTMKKSKKQSLPYFVQTNMAPSAPPPPTHPENILSLRPVALLSKLNDNKIFFPSCLVMENL